MPHDDRCIEVYLGGTYLCTAYPAQRLSPEQTEAFLENAARERKRLTAERRKASARARAELAPLSRDETRAEESRVLSPGCCRPTPATSSPPAAVTRCCAARPAATCSA